MDGRNTSQRRRSDFMGWEYYNGKPQFYSYPNYVFNSGATKKYEKNGVDPGAGSLHYWSWQTGSIFKGHDKIGRAHV